MKTLAKVVGSALLLVAASGCSRNNIEAVNLANEGDKERGADVDSAISKYEQATQLDPSNYRILWKLATAYQKKEAWDKVATTCAKAESLAPTHADYFFLHGYALEQEAIKGPTNWTEAKGPLETAAKLDPNMGDAYFDLAEVMLHLDDEHTALEDYTKAIEASPDKLAFYGPLADLYIRLGFYDQADQVLNAAAPFKKDGDIAVFNVDSLQGEIKEIRGDISGAIASYEAARNACGQCNEKGEQIAYFNLGAAYARANPPRKSESIQQLTKFNKTVCKAAAAKSFEDECTQTQDIVRQMGGTL
ncbi:MAG: tetratricopeptide repeat protein [Polyangiaceae bacterium]